MRTCMTTFRKSLVTAILCCVLCLPASASPPDELIFLHYWTGSLSGGIDGMTQVFNQSSNRIRVKATPFEHEAFKVSLPAMLDSGNPPDMFSYWAGDKVESLVDQNQLLSIDEVWWKNDLDTVFGPAISKACTYRGHKYALPVTQHAVGIFYNKAIFKDHGLTPPQTFEDFLTVCRILKKSGVTPISLGAQNRWPAQFWFDYLLLRTAGPKFRNDLLRGRVPYDSPEVHRVFSMWKTMLDEGFFNESPTILDWGAAASLVHSGKAAMTLMGTWIIGMYDNQLHWTQGVDYDYFPFPRVSNDIPLAMVGPIDAIVVPRLGRPADTNSVLAFFAKAGPQMEMSIGSGALAPNKQVPSGFTPPCNSEFCQISTDHRTGLSIMIWQRHPKLQNTVSTHSSSSCRILKAFGIRSSHSTEMQEFISTSDNQSKPCSCSKKALYSI